MNSISKSHIKLSVLGQTLALVVLMTACSFAQEKPPPPKKAVTNLQMPKPVKVEDVKGEATLPEKLKLGFGIDLADKVLVGNWDVKGKVIAVDADKVTFVTDQGAGGHLVFRLPEELKLSLSADEPVFIKRTMRGNGVAFGYELVMTSSDKTVISAGRLFGDMPQQTKIITDALTLEQSQEIGQVLSESKYETTYQIAVTLIADGRNIPISVGEVHEVTSQGEPYNVIIQQSIKVVPAKEYEGVAEGSGYTLEYVVISK